MAWLSGWSYRKEISITGQSGAGTNYQVDLDIGDSAGGDFHLEGHCTNFPQDIEITDDDGTTPLDYWIEDIAADPLKMWVEVADDLGSNQTIYVYYGKSGATTDSDGTATFLFFDNFEDNDTTDWTEEAGASFDPVSSPVKIGSYAAELTNTGTGVQAYKSIGTDVQDSIYELYVRVPQTDTSKYVLIEKTGGDYTNSVYLYFSTGPNIYYYDGSSHILQSYTTDTWYRFQITTHPSADTFDIKIDGVSRGTGLGTRGSIIGGINAISFMGWTAGGSIYADMIFNRKYNSPEPAFNSAGSEETPPAIGHPWFYERKQ